MQRYVNCYFFFKKTIFFINHIFKFFGKKIAHAIKRYVRIGCELTSGNDIEKAIEGLSGTSVAQIEPNRDKVIIMKLEITIQIMLLQKTHGMKALLITNIC